MCVFCIPPDTVHQKPQKYYVNSTKVNFVDLHKAPFLFPPTCDGRRVQSREGDEVGESVMGDLMQGGNWILLEDRMRMLM